jgi:4-hydroxy-tetrahydrodipicolinate reductase
MKLLIVGYGRMGQLIQHLAPSYDFDVVGTVDAAENAGGRALTGGRWAGVDVAIEFTHPHAAADNLRALIEAGLTTVIGTTGWRDREADLRALVERAGVGVVAAANFSLGANLLEALATHAVALLRGRDDYGAWLHELHHAAKRDAPSGTALAIVEAMQRADPTRAVDVASTRAGHMPGTHTVGFDGPAEQLTMTHLVRDRATFAHGALVAARWVAGRRGWFTMRDVLGL